MAERTKLLRQRIAFFEIPNVQYNCVVRNQKLPYKFYDKIATYAYSVWGRAVHGSYVEKMKVSLHLN